MLLEKCIIYCFIMIKYNIVLIHMWLLRLRKMESEFTADLLAVTASLNHQAGYDIIVVVPVVVVVGCVVAVSQS